MYAQTKADKDWPDLYIGKYGLLHFFYILPYKSVCRALVKMKTNLVSCLTRAAAAQADKKKQWRQSSPN